jgi:sugar phosphate permease
MSDMMPTPKKIDRSRKYTGLIIRIVLAIALGYAIYYLYIETYLDGMLKY